jgi:aminopeptidase N
MRERKRASCAILILILSTATSAMALIETTRAERGLHVDMRIEPKLSEGILTVRAEVYFEKVDLQNGHVSVGLNPDLKVSSLQYDGADLPYEINEFGLDLDFSGINFDSRVPAVFEYSGTSSNPGFLYTSEVNSFASWLTFWYPSIDNIDGLVGNTTIVVPQGYTATSTGVLTSQKSVGNTVEFTFRNTTPNYYSFIAARYQVHSRIIDGIEYKTFLISGGKEKSDFYIRRCADTVNTLKAAYGKYPYDNFKLVEMADMGGAIAAGFSEHGLIFLPSQSVPNHYFNYPVIAHEIGHLWWGNWVIGEEHVISEGMAQLSLMLQLETLYGEKTMYRYAEYGSRDHFMSSFLYKTHFLYAPDNEPAVADDFMTMDQHHVSIGKGTRVLLMLRDYLGADAFYKGLHAAIKNETRQQTKLRKLVSYLEQASGKDLTEFYQQWFARKGLPHLDLEYGVMEQSGRYLLKGVITQKNLPAYKMPLELGIENGSAIQTEALELKGPETPFSFTLAYQPSAVVLDPNLKSLFITDKEIELKSFAKTFAGGLKTEEEIEVFRKLLEKDPDNGMIRVWMAPDIAFGQNRHKDAIAFLEETVATAKFDGDFSVYAGRAMLMLGQLYDLTGQRGKALEMYRRIESDEPTGRFNELVRAYQQQPYTRR